MKKELFLKILVAVLSGIIVILLIIIFTSNKCAPAKSTMHKITVNQHCIFNYTMDRFNKLSSIETADLCLGLSQLNISDIVLGGKKQNVYVRYYTDLIYDDNTFTGIYINGERTVPNASPDFINKLAVSNDLLFVVSNDKKKTNIMAFDSDIDNVFDLSKKLENTQVQDPTLGDVLKAENIDYKYVEFGDHELTFNTNSTQKCKDGSYSGSTFKITYDDEGFRDPVFVSSRTCN